MRNNHKTESSYEEIGAVLGELAKLIAAKTGHDFTQYKRSTLIRRVHRRMQFLSEPDPRDYMKRLREDPDEARAFFEEMLIGVTRFFRDPESFRVLQEKAIRQVFDGHPSDETVRIWVPGCSSGEEIYSIAMLIREETEPLDGAPAVKIFGTDIDERALQTARKGLFPAKSVEEVGEERLERFFDVRGEHYQVKPQLREMCLFSSHNLVSDPPFSQMDLISCRNLLIYFDAPLQDKIVPLFHYALSDDGYLFLGSSETLTSYDELFHEVDVKHRLWQRRNTGARRPSSWTVPALTTSGTSEPSSSAELELDVEERMAKAVMARHAPATAVVSPEGHILCASDSIGRYLSVSGGRFQNNVVQMARTGLRGGLRAALSKVKRRGERVVHPNMSIQTDDGVQPVRLVVEPLSDDKAHASDLFLLVFADEGRALSASDHPIAAPDEDTETFIAHLERELRSTRADLERTVQELEAANEELKSSNEELLSMNEELQSANEELEASNDEVESANHALEQAKADLENLLASTKIATLFLDDQRRIQWFTPAIAQIYNLRERDIGRPLAEITHRVDQMPPLPPAEALDQSEEPLEHEVEAGQQRYLRRVQPYRDDDGPTGGMVMTFVDVTELQQAQTQLEARTAELERSKEQLERSMQHAEAANQSKSEFLANMSHEIRTPMTAILGYAEVLTEHLEDPDNRQCVDTIVRNGNFLLEIINDILDLSKIEAGKLDIERSQVAPDALIAEVASLMYVRAEEKGLPLEVEFDGPLPVTVETDPRRVRQILVNLVGNALKFTDEGSVGIHVAYDESAGQLHCRVVDTGIGISLEEQDKLFQPFTQGDSSRTRRYGGTGLGLTICGRLASALGGTIDVDSTPGEGSTFTLSIPVGELSQVELVEPRPSIIMPDKSEPEPPAELESHVLVVDDRHEIRYLAHHFIGQAGGTTELAENGEEAIACVEQAEQAGRPFDLVVMDMQMPVMDGFEATRRLREDGFERPILALTAGAMREDRQRCLEAGCDDHISKPIEANKLAAIIASYHGKTTAELPSAEDRTSSNLSDESEQPQAGGEGERASVLLVEDDEDTREALCMMLKLSGISTMSCADGHSALELARTRQPEAVVLDIGLPDLSGYKVCQELKDFSALDDTVFIALTGRSTDEEIARSHDAGFDHHVVKPPAASELVELIEREVS